MTLPRLAKLRSSIDRAAQCYYYGTPLISDDQYDALLAELRELVPNDDRLTRVGHPVPPDSMLKKVKHTTFTGSLDKCDDSATFRKWHQKIGSGGLAVCLKIDGNSLVLYYDKGELVRAVTRGGDDGVGEDVTANAIRSQGVPTHLSRPLTVAVRGESVLPVAAWLDIDPSKDSNPRNLGSGLLRRVEGAGAELLHYYAFDLDVKDGELATEDGKLALLKELGFDVVPHQLATSTDVALRLYGDVVAKRDKLPYWIDGVVFKLLDLNVQRRLGHSHGRPRGQTVLKFEAEGADTVITGITVTIGHTGAIIPTANLATVRIGGTNVSSALLNNYDEIDELDVAIGDTVRVIKAKDIIPKVVAVVSRPTGRQLIPVPTTCPACGGSVDRRVLTKRANGKKDALAHLLLGRVLECKNDDCPAKDAGRLKTWIKKLDIQGIGDEVRAALLDSGVTTPADLYRLASEPVKMAFLPGIKVGNGKLGQKRAKTIIDNINAKRQLPLNMFLGSLGVPHLGRRRAQLIMEAVPGEMDTLADWRGDKLLEIAERAQVPNIAREMVAGLEALAGVIDDLLRYVTVTDHTPAPAAKAAGKQWSFVLTGAMSKPRKDIVADIEAAGHVASDRIAAGVDYLVQADPSSTSSKTAKAQKLGTKVISETALYDLLAKSAC